MICPEHGGRYVAGCPACQVYQRERVRRNRADRLASGRLNHGVRSAYDAGCRCAACSGVRLLDAAAEARAQRTLKRRERYEEELRLDNQLRSGRLGSRVGGNDRKRRSNREEDR